MINEEEIELVKRATNKDAHAFALLYEKIYKKMYSYALYVLNNEMDAQDAVSETVMDAFISIDKLQSPEAFRQWIFRILHNKCNQKMRTYYSQRECDDISEHEELKGKEHDIEAAIDVKKAFSKLEEQERIIIGMHTILGIKTKEIAKLLGIKDTTVRSKESRALKKMRKWLAY